MSKSFYIKTYGCQMNFYDSDRIKDLVEPLGYKLSERPEGCDLAILNTCHIREKASEKMYSDIGRLSKFKNNQMAIGNQMTIVICGCVAQAEGKEILRKNKFVDIVLGPQNYHILPKILETKKKNEKYLENNFPDESKFDFFPEQNVNGCSAFVTIQEGCDKFCSFCVVPYTRGSEFSRSVNEIEFEVRSLVSKGIKEITLLGQNVNSYHGKRTDFNGKKIQYNLASLCSDLSKIKNLERIRYITSHPSDMNNELIFEHKKNNKLMPYLHLPIQSGSNKILKKMNRKYTREEYIEIVNNLRYLKPDIALSSDFIVGYPGETQKDFEETLSLVKKIRFASSYSFKYSPRPGTPSSLKNQTSSDKEIEERLRIIQYELNKQQKEFNFSFLGKNLSVLFEKIGKKKNQYVGRSQYLQPVHVISSESLIGKILSVKIEKITSFSLHGSVQ